MQSFQTSIPRESRRTIPLVQNQAIDWRTKIPETLGVAAIDQLARALWAQWGAGLVEDSLAESLIEQIAARKKILQTSGLTNPWSSGGRASPTGANLAAPRRPSWFPAKQRRAISPDRRASLERRRHLAASGPMPPAMASSFTTGELATLRIIADEIRAKGACRLSMGEIAARAGVGQTTARNALRQACRQNLLVIEERRRYLQPNLPNIVRVISPDWLAWIRRANPKPFKKGGFKKTQPTDKDSFKSSMKPENNRVHREKLRKITA